MKRTITMFRNAMNNDEAVSQVGRYLGAKTPVIALKLGMLGLKFMAFSAAIQAWNTWKHPDEEDALPEEMRSRPHIILGTTKSDHGTNIIYFPRVGVVGDFLEWFGVDSAPSDARDIMALIVGGASSDQIGSEFQKIFGRYGGLTVPKRITDKIAMGLGPQYKMPLEFVMREKFFPSIWNRQPITDVGRWVAEQGGLQGLYDYTTGRPQQKGALNKTIKGLAIYEQDRTRLGWLAFRQKVVEYQRDNGLRGKGFIITETGTALYNMGLSWRYGDMKALTKYYTEYMLLNIKRGKFSGFERKLQESWEKLHPLADLNEVHRAMFMSKLDARGWKQMILANQYYNEIASGMQFINKD